MDYSDKPILVTGAARSGTSMVGACVHLCGAFKGDTVGPSKWNRKGMYENHVIRERVVKPILMNIGMDKRGQYPLPKTEDIIIPQKFKETVLKVLESQGWTPDKPWMYKCAKMSLIWPVWQYAFPNSKWVIVRRKTADIVRSCMRTGFMTAFANEKVQKAVGVDNERDGWLWWVHQHEEKFIEIIKAGLNVQMVWPERMVNADYEQMMHTIEWLGLTWNGSAVMDFIEPKLWKARR
jgi:hypothetical protein